MFLYFNNKELLNHSAFSFGVTCLCVCLPVTVTCLPVTDTCLTVTCLPACNSYLSACNSYLFACLTCLSSSLGGYPPFHKDVAQMSVRDQITQGIYTFIPSKWDKVSKEGK